MNYGALLQAVLPETALALTAFLALAADLLLLRGRSPANRRRAATALAVAGAVVSAVCVAALPQQASFGAGVLVLDPLGQLVKLALLALAAFTALLLRDSDFTPHIGEFVALLLLAVVAMMFLVSTENLLAIFLSLEMTSLCLYVMTAFNKRNPLAAEAGLKYFLFGGVAAAFMLFGLSLLYGLTGHTHLREIAARLAGAPLEPALVLALVMTLIGLGFKIACAPFHLWAPDAYQGAPLPAAALVASGSKLASFFVLARLLLSGLSGAEGAAAYRAFEPGWAPLLAALAALSLVVGNLAAIAQTSVRRLLAFSAVAQAGYILVGLLGPAPAALASVLYYAVTYGFTLIGAFAVVGFVERHTGADSLEAFAGLGRRDPVMGACLLVFVLSLAGIPPLAGFFGKFYLFTAALQRGPDRLGLLWLVALALAMSAVSLYYYLQILKQAYVAEPRPERAPGQGQLATRLVVLALAALVILLGVLPSLLIEPLRAAIRLP